MYIQPRQFYLIFRNVSANNMNWVILHYVGPSNGVLDAAVETVAVKALRPGGEH